MNEQFEIRIDGVLQEPSKLEVASTIAANGLLTVSKALGRAVTNVVRECATNVVLSYTDAQEGSHLHAEYHARKRAARIGAIASQAGLTVS